MPAPYHGLHSPDELAVLLADYPFTRRVREVHLHHTWRPNHAQDRGLASVEAMARYHTGTLGWSDIAQHLTVDSEGRLWTGRDWNRAPASAAGYNGSAADGPFMIEVVGDFDLGRDPFEGAQREATVAAVAHVQRRFGLPPEALRFHNEMSSKSCPGTSLDRAEVVAAVRAAHAEIEGGEAAPPALFGPETLAVRGTLRALVDGADRALPDDPADAEPPERRMSREHVFALFGGEAARGGGSQTGGAGGPRLTPEMLDALRPHVVNLTNGRLSGSGAYQTTEADVRAIFEEHVPAALKRARAAGRPLQVVFYAHGGLTSEAAALEKAYAHVQWWTERPDVFPVYFVWETDLVSTVRQLLRGQSRALDAAPRGPIGDRVVEAVLGIGKVGARVWGGMKANAARGSAPGGGARLVAAHLRDFAGRYHKAFGAGEVRLHAVGHSAGSVFHGHFVPTALDLGVPAFASAHFLAPAVRLDEFLERLAPHLGNGVGHLSLFTMRKDFELADSVGGVYRKSLLYLIRNALEWDAPEPVLGLEESLRADDRARALFGLGGAASDAAEVVFSPTASGAGRSASRATTHGGFDDDAATMEAVLRRVVGAADGEEVPPFPDEGSRGAEDWEVEEPLPEDVAALLRPAPPVVAAPPALAAPPLPDLAVSGDGAGGAVPPGEGGRRRALCVGINAYARQPLAGCVADAEAWASALRERGFEVETLLDGAATRDALLGRLRALVGSGAPGDVLVFQFAGHGTRIADADGDEGDRQDEAFCPVDVDTGAVVLDDEVRETFGTLAEGVNLTCFVDCCHSGSITRLALAPGADARPRTLQPTPAMRAFVRDLKASRGASRSAPPDAAPRDVTFSACQPHELAWESDGQGEFTGHSVAVLRGQGGLSNAAFFDAVDARFGAERRQSPYFDPAPEARARPLLAPLAAPPSNGRAGGPQTGEAEARDVVESLHRAVAQFERALSELT